MSQLGNSHKFNVDTRNIVIVIAIYVKKGFYKCLSGFLYVRSAVYEAIISDQSRDEKATDPSIRKDVIIITREKSLDLNYKFRTVKIINYIYYGLSTVHQSALLRAS